MIATTEVGRITCHAFTCENNHVGARPLPRCIHQDGLHGLHSFVHCNIAHARSRCERTVQGRTTTTTSRETQFLKDSFSTPIIIRHRRSGTTSELSPVRELMMTCDNLEFHTSPSLGHSCSHTHSARTLSSGPTLRTYALVWAFVVSAL